MNRVRIVGGKTVNSVRIVDILFVMRFLIVFAADHVVVRIINLFVVVNS